jgi:hypothetical protein
MTDAKTPTYFTDKHAQSMTLRDHFAGLAMQSMVDTKGAAYLNQGGYEAVSMMAYLMADAMLERRKT